jgi:hypothetical protein
VLRVIGCVVGAIVVILLYEMIGIFAAYKKQPELSEETKQSLHPEDIYTDASVEERACGYRCLIACAIKWAQEWFNVFNCSSSLKFTIFVLLFYFYHLPNIHILHPYISIIIHSIYDVLKPRSSKMF